MRCKQFRRRSVASAALREECTWERISNRGGRRFSQRNEWSGPQPVSDYLYQGMTLDQVTGLYYARNRNYSPSLGVWISQDPAGYVNGADTYQFVVGRPTGYADPSGLDLAPGTEILASGGVVPGQVATAFNPGPGGLYTSTGSPGTGYVPSSGSVGGMPNPSSSGESFGPVASNGGEVAAGEAGGGLLEGVGGAANAAKLGYQVGTQVVLPFLNWALFDISLPHTITNVPPNFQAPPGELPYVRRKVDVVEYAVTNVQAWLLGQESTYHQERYYRNDTTLFWAAHCPSQAVRLTSATGPTNSGGPLQVTEATTWYSDVVTTVQLFDWTSVKTWGVS
ncbi:MAG: RHS repeat-associated core domain-containing protein [Phycisphaerales bacterium]|nr:RHS repeat-associated core domain-containing protein [Phycisphaerales bacterium]